MSPALCVYITNKRGCAARGLIEMIKKPLENIVKITTPSITQPNHIIMTDILRGSCLCEGVKFTVQGGLGNVFLCYCTHYSKNAGTPAQVVRPLHLVLNFLSSAF